MRKYIKLIAPATSANLGPGFDVLAIALQEPCDIVEVEYWDKNEFEISLNVSGNYEVPKDLNKNVLSLLLFKISEKYNLKGKLNISLIKNIPVGMGLGSSAASCVSAVLIAKNIFNINLSLNEMIYIAGEGESFIAGSPHYDNVTACLMGGFVITPIDNLDPVSIMPDKELCLCIVLPKIQLPIKKTEYARKILPQSISLKQMSDNISKSCRIVYSFLTHNYKFLRESMKDYVVEIHRSKMIPGFEEVRNVAYEKGAIGVCISGAGPSILAIIDKRNSNPHVILNAMINAFNKNEVYAEGLITHVSEGAKVLERVEK
jgi:homoserine kinase